MSRIILDDILRYLQLKQNDPPNYVNKLFLIRYLVSAWIDNMHANYTPGWISCLDNSMMVWSNKFTRPGCMFVPRKPHPCGNDWHSICCGVSGVIFAVNLVEGKDRPIRIEPREIEGKGKNCGLLLSLIKQLR
jgi:Transposase IS4